MADSTSRTLITLAATLAVNADVRLLAESVVAALVA